MKYNHFLQYLERMKILRKFQDNLYEDRKVNLLEYYQLFNGGNYSDLITGAFAWDKTPEGSGFWYHIHSHFIGFYLDYKGD